MSPWLIPSGKTWDGKAVAVGPDGDSFDANCVAFRETDDGMIEVADTKVDLDKQTPLRFTPREVDDFARAWLARRP